MKELEGTCVKSSQIKPTVTHSHCCHQTSFHRKYTCCAQAPKPTVTACAEIQQRKNRNSYLINSSKRILKTRTTLGMKTLFQSNQHYCGASDETINYSWIQNTGVWLYARLALGLSEIVRAKMLRIHAILQLVFGKTTVLCYEKHTKAVELGNTFRPVQR